MSEELKPCPKCGSTSVHYYYDEYDGVNILCRKCRFELRATNEALAFRNWNALPRRLRWTKEKPTQGGEWYWYRGADGELAIGYLLGNCLALSGKRYVYIDNDVPGEFAGPIHKPEEE